jgi:sulfur carrier protein ThiS
MSDPLPPDTAPAILTYRKLTFTIPPWMTVRQAIQHCHLNPETILATRAGQLITDEVIVQPGDQITLIATISGG